MPKPRVGFHGLGWIGRHRMEAMLATGAIEAVAFCEPNEAQADEAIILAPNAVPASSLEAMLALGLDGVVIATPSALHAEQSIAALNAGCSVFCQKPLGRNAAEAAAVVDAARTADRLLSVDFSYRHTAAMDAIAPLVRDGALGTIRAVDLTFHNAYGPDKPWFYDKAQSGGGCVMDLGVHLVDLALWTLGFPALVQVDAQLLAGDHAAGADEVEDYAVATLRTAEGAIVRLACSWRLQAGREAVIEAAFYGSSGGAALRNVNGSFYDFTAERFSGTQSEMLASPPDAWGGRAAADWAVQLAQGIRFDPKTERLVDVAAALDRIYAAASGSASA